MAGGVEVVVIVRNANFRRFGHGALVRGLVHHQRKRLDRLPGGFVDEAVKLNRPGEALQLDGWLGTGSIVPVGLGNHGLGEKAQAHT